MNPDGEESAAAAALGDEWSQSASDDEMWVSPPDNGVEPMPLSTPSIDSYTSASEGGPAALSSTGDDESFAASSTGEYDLLELPSDGGPPAEGGRASRRSSHHEEAAAAADGGGGAGSSTDSGDGPRSHGGRRVVMRADGRTARLPALVGDGMRWRPSLHRRRRQPGGRCECEACSQKFANEVLLWRHVRLVHGHDDHRYLVCPLVGCGKRFSSVRHLDAHSAHHREMDWLGRAAGRRPQTCELCGSLAESVTSLFRHVRAVHRTAALYTCGVCVLMFGDGASLGQHVLHNHASEFRGPRQRLRCGVCGQVSSDERRLQKHQLRH